MFLISLANILPRRASMTAFLCLVVAHLEWPLMMSSLVHRSPRSYRGAPRARGDGLRRRGGDRRPRARGGVDQAAAATPRPLFPAPSRRTARAPAGPR